MVSDSHTFWCHSWQFINHPHLSFIYLYTHFLLALLNLYQGFKQDLNNIVFFATSIYFNPTWSPDLFWWKCLDFLIINGLGTVPPVFSTNSVRERLFTTVIYSRLKIAYSCRDVLVSIPLVLKCIFFLKPHAFYVINWNSARSPADLKWFVYNSFRQKKKSYSLALASLGDTEMV